MSESNEPNWHEALLTLHRQANFPSTRTIARLAGCSHTTVAEVLNGRRQPTRELLSRIVEALNGVVDEFPFPAGQNPATPLGHYMAQQIVELQRIRRLLEKLVP